MFRIQVVLESKQNRELCDYIACSYSVHLLILELYLTIFMLKQVFTQPKNMRMKNLLGNIKNTLTVSFSGKMRVMRLAAFATIIFLMSQAPLQAGVPRGFNYQAVVRNNTGALAANQSVGMRFSIHQDSLGGGVVYRETHTKLTNQFGVITIVIGGGAVVHGNIDSINWAASNYYLQVETDPAGGVSYIDMGTTQLMSVPYAQYAKTAGAMALVYDSVPTVTGNTPITITPTTSYLGIGSSVPAASAVITLPNGQVPGQCVVIIGTSGSGNGVRLSNGGNVNVGNSNSGNVDIQKGSILMLMWNTFQWVKMSYSDNQ
jgi:hypothetical protein